MNAEFNYFTKFSDILSFRICSLPRVSGVLQKQLFTFSVENAVPIYFSDMKILCVH